MKKFNQQEKSNFPYFACHRSQPLQMIENDVQSNLLKGKKMNIIV